jgi:hypothetical protein
MRLLLFLNQKIEKPKNRKTEGVRGGQLRFSRRPATPSRASWVHPRYSAFFSRSGEKTTKPVSLV